MIIFLPLFVALLGVLMYALSSNPKVQELGRICFAMGLLAFLLRGGGEAVGLLGK